MASLPRNIKFSKNCKNYKNYKNYANYNNCRYISTDHNEGTPYTVVPSRLISPRHFYQNTVLIPYIERKQIAVSLRQLSFFGRRLTIDKLITSGNFCRTELPTRLAHRIRDMQKLPYYVVSNPHLSLVYEIYYNAFDQFRRFRKIQTIDDNLEFCLLVSNLLDTHLSVIPNLIIGAIESSPEGILDYKNNKHIHSKNHDYNERVDLFINSMLRSRISRRVIGEQHLSLTRSYISNPSSERSSDYIGEVILSLPAQEAIELCVKEVSKKMSTIFPITSLPKVIIQDSNMSLNSGLNSNSTFPYIPSHFQYIMGEILRNSMQATMAKYYSDNKSNNNGTPPPIVISLGNTTENLIIRVSDQGGGIPDEKLSDIWSFAKKSSNKKDRSERLENLRKVPLLSESTENNNSDNKNTLKNSILNRKPAKSSLAEFTRRPSDMKLGIGLPMSRVYAEYWAGSLDLQSLKGYGTDVCLRISKLGNQSERLQLDYV